MSENREQSAEETQGAVSTLLRVTTATLSIQERVFRSGPFAGRDRLYVDLDAILTMNSVPRRPFRGFGEDSVDSVCREDTSGYVDALTRARQLALKDLRRAIIDSEPGFVGLLGSLG